MMAKKEQQAQGFTHPTGKKPERIAIIGLGPTSQDWHAAHVQYTPPLEPVDEVWTVNKGFRTINCDLCFIMDDLIDEARKSPRYGNEIAATEVPIITSTVDEIVKARWPAVHRYPLENVLAYWGAQIYGRRTKEREVQKQAALDFSLNECAYFSNSIPYMLAYAGYIGVKQIAMFGCDYTFPGSVAREDDRANAEYWIAALQFGQGVLFQFPHRTTILNRDKGRTFYGFNGRQPY
jgi:hypothetical protein